MGYYDFLDSEYGKMYEKSFKVQKPFKNIRLNEEFKVNLDYGIIYSKTDGDEWLKNSIVKSLSGLKKLTAKKLTVVGVNEDSPDCILSNKDFTEFYKFIHDPFEFSKMRNPIFYVSDKGQKYYENQHNLHNKNLKESEFSDDLKNIYGIGKSDDEIRQEQEEKLRDLIDEIKDIRYGFKDKVTGEVYDNREWIHNCKDLSRYYEVQKDPRITLKDKLGICTDQCLAIEYLIKQKYQDIKPCLYALMKGRFGHCTLGFNDGNKYYYLENAWDKMKKDDKPTLYGPFESEDKLKDFFKDIYFKAHEKDNDDPVEVMRYNEYLQEYGLNESVDIRKFK